VLTRSEGKRPPALDSILARYNPDAVVFHCGLEPGTLVRPDGEAVASRSLQGFAVYAFSGIARPDRFEADLTRLGMRLVGARRFPDHHRFRRGDLAAVSRAARERRADVLLTTEKDLVRLADRPEGGPPLYALSIRVTFPPGPGLPAFILDRLAARRGSGRPRVTS
ncbi:MAG TPA: tetraacyldisaccharide 4'-kinase, partial [Candidatus Polarisedimenticolia bacterium]|nr:tetraacyldisaccharide 4'-kinase [Candidatus Polarisedimenticolia bacterium]